MRKISLTLTVIIMAALVTGCATPTQPAPAAMVNGKPIPMAQYERQMELAINYLQQHGVDTQSFQGRELLAQVKEEVLDQLIEQELINQAAAKEGFTVTDEEIDKELASLVQEAGGQERLDAWMQANKLTQQDLRQALRDQILSDKVFQKVTASVATTAEQVHASHILVATREEANAVLTRLKNGEDFAKLAAEVSLDEGSKDNGGDLGFFPKGALIPELEEAAFALQPGQFSDPVQTAYGFHIVLVVAREANRPLSPELLHAAQQEAFTQWLESQKAAAKIEKLVK